MEIITKPKIWGNSFGVLISKEKAKEENIDENSTVLVEIKKINPVSDLFGMLKRELKGFDTQKWKDEERRLEKRREEEKFKQLKKR